MAEHQRLYRYKVDREEAERARALMSELDKLAFEAYIADCQAQGIFVETEWHELNSLTQKRYRAIANQIRTHFTDGHMTASQLERSLIASLAAIGIEVQRHEGDDVTETHYIWRVNALDLGGRAATFNQVLTDLIQGYRES